MIDFEIQFRAENKKRMRRKLKISVDQYNDDVFKALPLHLKFTFKCLSFKETDLPSSKQSTHAEYQPFPCSVNLQLNSAICDPAIWTTRFS